jgi:hypothetical protein
MKSAKNQQKRKAYYFGTSAQIVYQGTRTQPGTVGQPAGSKLATKAQQGRVGARTVGVVSKAYIQMQKNQRAA